MISGVCDDVELYSACIIGAIAGLLYLKVRQIFDRANIDDPMQSAQIHGICGFFGVLNVGIFGGGAQNYTQALANKTLESDTVLNASVFNVLLIQLLGATSLAIWAGIVSYAFFKILSNMGHLRVGQFYEIVGIDILTHTMSDLIGMDDNFLRDSKKYMMMKKDGVGNQMLELEEGDLYEDEL